MKKYFLLLSLAFAVSFTACKPKEAETTATINLDAIGEADTVANYPNTLDDASIIQATCNGIEQEFKFIDPYMNPDSKYKAYFNRRKDGSGCSISFARGTHNDLRNKITIFLANFDAETLQYPLEWKFDATNNTKSARIIYEVKKSAVPILYYSDNTTTSLKLISYKDGVLEGTFSCKVVNQGKRVIDITDGSFKMKLDKIEQ
jgi:hypothetical protein